MKNIVVMGTCEAEEQGVLSLLEGMDIPALFGQVYHRWGRMIY